MKTKQWLRFKYNLFLNENIKKAIEEED